MCHYRQAMDLFTASQSREIDALLIERTPVAGYELMCRAGRACFDALKKRWPRARNVAIVCGGGNNGGDGYVLARLLLEREYAVNVYEMNGGAGRGDALQAKRDYLDAGGATVSSDRWPDAADVVVDALFGTGLSRPLDDRAHGWVARLNADGRPVLAVDVPSGLDADTGAMLPEAVRAEATVTFITRKRGMYTSFGRDRCGEIFFSRLDTAPELFSHVKPAARLVDWFRLRHRLPPREENVHKGHFGYVLVVGGAPGMGGAVRLAGEAALRTGAGRVGAVVDPLNRAAITAGCPELMVYETDGEERLRELLELADVVVVGPGLGQSARAQALLSQVLEARQPRVIDADALNLLAAEPAKADNWVLTPHPGEAARLLGANTADIGGDRFAAAGEIASLYGGVCVLKGAGTLVVSDGDVSVCAGGNAGMATAGTGDVLAGVIAALLAQGLTLRDAAELGVCIHAAAGDRAAGSSPRGLLASDLIAHIRTYVNPEVNPGVNLGSGRRAG